VKRCIGEKLQLGLDRRRGGVRGGKRALKHRRRGKKKKGREDEGLPTVHRAGSRRKFHMTDNVKRKGGGGKDIQRKGLPSKLGNREGKHSKKGESGLVPIKGRRREEANV